MKTAGCTSISAGFCILAGILNVGLLSGANGLIFAGLSTAAASTGIGLILLGIMLIAAVFVYVDPIKICSPAPMPCDRKQPLVSGSENDSDDPGPELDDPAYLRCG